MFTLTGVGWIKRIFGSYLRRSKENGKKNKKGEGKFHRYVFAMLK
jgi:hypothetical protein